MKAKRHFIFCVVQLAFIDSVKGWFMFRVSSSEKQLTVNIRSSTRSTVGQFKANDTLTIKEKIEHQLERKYECVCLCGREGTGI